MINKKTFAAVICMSAFCGETYALPESPKIVRDVHMAHDGKYTRPTLPPTQTSADSRVALSHKSKMFFRLHVPEKLTTNFVNSPAGTSIYSTPDAAPDAVTAVPIPSQNRHGHVSLCDPSFDPNSNVKNPRVCGTDDCYDMYVVGFRNDSLNGNATKRLVSTEVTVRVSDPKTTNAKISSVTLGDVALSNTHLPLNDTMFEPMIVGDGNLLMARLGPGGNTMPWTNSKGVTKTEFVNVVYMVNDNPDNFEACDVMQWDKVYPLSHAPYDNTINQRYGFAMQKFKDSEGNEIPEDSPFWGSYPWIDKDADNISLTTFDDALLRQGGGVYDSVYDYRCPLAVNGCSADSEVDDYGNQGRVIMGLWTRGKMVHLDGILSHVNWAVNSEDHNHREVKFYDGALGHDGYIRVGNGRENNINLMPAGSAGNTDFFDSNEHRFNYLKHMKPVTPRDVVWLMSSGSATTEVSFDDYMNVHTFINSNMTNSIEVRHFESRFWTRGVIRHDDRVQNASTSPLWNVPSYGQVIGGGRIEEQANGGIEGRGFWLDGAGSGIEYDIPAQPSDIDNKNRYISLFFDLRDSRTDDRTLISFPDGSKLKLRDKKYLRYHNTDGSLAASINVNKFITRNGWTHLGLQVLPNSNKVKAYLNGIHFHNFTYTNALFQMTPGKLTLGVNPNNANESFKGWIDNFTVAFDSVNREVACNNANGSLVGVNGALGSWWQTVADRTPSWVNSQISNHLTSVGETTYSQYFCHYSYGQDNNAHLGKQPGGTVSIRDAFNFSEGPIKHDAPRPDSLNNAFCLSCHTATGRKGLSLGALTLIPGLNAIDDPRRQPTQPEPRVFGNIPANWLGAGLPANDINANATTGYAIDQLVLPSVND